MSDEKPLKLKPAKPSLRVVKPDEWVEIEVSNELVPVSTKVESRTKKPGLFDYEDETQPTGKVPLLDNHPRPKLGLPSYITTIGLIAGLLGVWLRSTMLLVGSVLFDCLDGWFARKFKAVTQLGASLDWWCDVIIANALAVRLIPTHPVHAAFIVGGSLICQLLAAYTGKKLSGRAIATIIAVHAFWV